jgi:peptidyl-prolyl cis-trans isomerase SurA
VASKDQEEGAIVFLQSLKKDVQNNGVSFDSLAQLFSQDPGSSPSGGYLGYTSRGSLVKEYEEIAYSLFPGDISDPVQTDFGFHLIKLLDKRGEKISTQHILRTVGFSQEDKNIVLTKANLLYFQTINNPFLFDSLANVYLKKYSNNSGKYLNYSKSDIPNYIFSNIKLLDHFNVSSPIETDRGYILIYYYNHQKERVPDIENSWNLIQNYAKQKKQSVFFQNWINSIKSKIYINIINH